MNVLDIAKKRRGTISRELSHLDDFIRMGEELLREHRATEGSSTDQPKEPGTVREFAAGGQGKG